MADADNLSEIRTTEYLINAVSILYFNLNEIERTYYNIFINTTPMDVELQRYDDQGVLETITVPNRAKDSQSAYTGSGSPEGVVSANIGAHYVDTASGSIYYKSEGTGATGWALIWTALNLNYLAPDGDASGLTNLNMSAASSGTLAVGRGGTGTNGITGLVKGNGTSAFTAAVDGQDFMGPNSMCGLVAYYPVSTIPSGWILCNGAAYSRTTYANLFSVIGTTYGAGDGSTTFNVPNLMGDSSDTKNTGSCFIRCWDGTSAFNTTQYDNVGKHKHTLSGTTDTESAHTHTRGTMNITGGYKHPGWSGYDYTGAVYAGQTVSNYAGSDQGGTNTNGFLFDASKSWVGQTSGGSAHSHTLSGSTDDNTTDVTETRVLNKMLVPIIKF